MAAHPPGTWPLSHVSILHCKHANTLRLAFPGSAHSQYMLSQQRGKAALVSQPPQIDLPLPPKYTQPAGKSRRKRPLMSTHPACQHNTTGG